MSHHDHSYKLLFSHPEMVRDLLEGFVREDWLQQLDYASLEKVSSSYISDDLRARADDIVWRIRWGENWIYIYLLIEFQSSVEPYMIVRILTYVGLLYQDLIKAAQLPADGRLPPVLPIVLYNGDVRWRAAQELSALIQPGPCALNVYQPQMRYLLIDERLNRDSEQRPLRNLVAALFQLENSRTGAEVDLALENLIEWLRSPEQQSLRRAFVVWIGRVILARVPGAPANKIDDLQEMRTMFRDQFKEWREAIREEVTVHAQSQGVRLGESKLLLRQLHKRFGDLPPWVHSLVEQSSSETLESWAEGILDAEHLDELFSVEQRRGVTSGRTTAT